MYVRTSLIRENCMCSYLQTVLCLMSWPQLIQQVWLLWFFTLLTRKLPKLTPALFILYTKLYFTLQWRIQGRGLGAQVPPLFLDQTEARRAEKNFFGDLCTPTLHYLKVWSRHCTAHADYVICNILLVTSSNVSWERLFV